MALNIITLNFVLYIYREGAIQTDRVYPILILSGLAKEVLGHIWSMCNKMTPGQLIKEELYLVLGFIFLAQVNSKYNVLHCMCMSSCCFSDAFFADQAFVFGQ